MPKSFIELIVGDLGEKRAYQQVMKRANALPKDYRFTFKKIQQYMYNFGAVGCDITTFADLVDLLEVSAAEGKAVCDVIGSDVAAFCDELIRVSTNTATTQEKLNQEIAEHFRKEGK
ncbi:MAG: DUF1048 domain-containing protein [Lachnospiraceae bacterium]